MHTSQPQTRGTTHIQHKP